MSFNLTSFRYLFTVCVFWLLIAPSLSKQKDSHRSIVCIFTALTGLVYLVWRYYWTVTPFEGTTLETAWVYWVYTVEIIAFVEVCLFLLVMSKTNTRSKEADEYQKKFEEAGIYPPVDILIPTYNEGLDVLEKTIIGAKHIDYPNFKVWVLDDGRRDWLKKFCEEENVNYVTRSDNAHAKAGNLNNGLKHCNGDFFAIFDADFVPAKNFLRRTIGFFMYNPDIGLIQTPQHFYNRDPIQSNLYFHNIWPDDQRLFFDAMAPGRDKWGAAFCCGSCSITRRKAVDEVGGIPTSSITEDMLTTLCLLTKGYKTIYLNEKLSQGLSAESLDGFFIQRERWCRGNIQCFFVPEGPLRAKGLSIFQRLLFIPYGWVTLPITRMMMLVVPIVYMATGIVPLHFTSTSDLILYLFPMQLSYASAILWLAPKKYFPFFSTAIGVFTMFRLLPAAISSLIKPFGKPFRVTPKGSASKIVIDWYTLTCVLLLLATGFSSIIINLIPEYRILTEMQFFPFALMWTLINMCVLFICALLCFDAPRKRREERFIINEMGKFAGKDCKIVDMSLGGCKIYHGAGARIAERGEIAEIEIPDISKPLNLKITNSNANEIMGESYDLDKKSREEIIVKLFTGKYDNEIYHTESFAVVVKHLFQRALGKEMT